MTTHTIAYIKRQAKKLKKDQGISHTQALEIISKKYGYNNWKHCQRLISQQNTTHTKKVDELVQLGFTDWLRKHKNRNSPLGDLATDMIRDSNWPQYNTLEEYINYLSFRNASFGAIKALRSSWKAYTAYLRRKKSPNSNKQNKVIQVAKNNDQRKIVFLKNVIPVNYIKRTAEKFNPGDKAWISWDGRKAIPVTILEVDNRHYTFRALLSR